jgi:hypothetical protein
MSDMGVGMQSIHGQLVREAADGYTRMGFQVRIEPSESELPSWLRSFHPDLIVETRDGEKIVVEVKARGRVRPAAYWDELKAAIGRNPGWSFRLVLDNRREQELSAMEQPVLSQEQVEEQLKSGELLASQGDYRAALVVMWAAVEAALRDASRAQGIRLLERGPAALVTSLYSEGNLSRRDYDALIHIVQLRNSAVHGFQADDIRRSDVQTLQRIAKRLQQKRSSKNGERARRPSAP